MNGQKNFGTDTFLTCYWRFLLIEYIETIKDLPYSYLKIIQMTLNSSIFAGSPAEKADLEVADEILEVNGESLENSNHTDVIAHIHNVRMNLPLKVFWSFFSVLV